MSEERRLILKMVAEGKLAVEEADRLLAAIGGEKAGNNGNNPRLDAAYDFLSRIAQDVQKGLNDVTNQPGFRHVRDRLREGSDTLRARLEEMRRNAQPKPEKRREHTITVEVEEESAESTTANDATRKPKDGEEKRP
jgi:hypothetical protein